MCCRSYRMIWEVWGIWGPPPPSPIFTNNPTWTPVLALGNETQQHATLR